MTAIPTLDSSGWATTPAARAERALVYFLVSDFSQSTTHYGTIKSLPHLLQQHGDDFTTLRAECQDILQRYFSQFFDTAKVTVDIDPVDKKENTAQYNMRLSVVVYDKGTPYSLGRLLSISNKTILKVVEQ